MMPYPALYPFSRLCEPVYLDSYLLRQSVLVDVGFSRYGDEPEM